MVRVYNKDPHSAVQQLTLCCILSNWDTKRGRKTISINIKQIRQYRVEGVIYIHTYIHTMSVIVNCNVQFST